MGRTYPGNLCHSKGFFESKNHFLTESPWDGEAATPLYLCDFVITRGSGQALWSEPFARAKPFKVHAPGDNSHRVTSCLFKPPYLSIQEEINWYQLMRTYGAIINSIMMSSLSVHWPCTLNLCSYQWFDSVLLIIAHACPTEAADNFKNSWAFKIIHGTNIYIRVTACRRVFGVLMHQFRVTWNGLSTGLTHSQFPRRSTSYQGTDLCFLPRHF